MHNIVASLWRTVLRNDFNNTIILLLRLHSTMKLSHVNMDI